MWRKQIFVYIDEEFAINEFQPKFLSLLLTGKFRSGVTEKVRLKRIFTSGVYSEACSTMQAPAVLSSAFSLKASARQGACKRSLFKSIGVSPENQRWPSKQ